MIIYLIYVVVINFITFVMFGYDKNQAKKGAWRVSEKTLFFLATIGGSVGAWVGMQVFHHKTRHWYFRIGIPVILSAQCVMIYLVIR